MSFAAATADDAPVIRGLLKASGLPASDLTPTLLKDFLVLREDSVVKAVGGLEWAGGEVLLRSLAVAPDMRGSGAGKCLVTALEQRARQGGARAVYLLTTTAEPYFAALGYRPAPRQSAPVGIRQTAQFAELCPSNSAFMVKILGPVV